MTLLIVLCKITLNLLIPNDKVIIFIKRNFSDKSDIVVLDFGCGGGRNTVALLNEGYSVVAMDYTESAVQMTKEKCEKIKATEVKVIQNKGLDIPLDDCSIDAVVADGSLFCVSKEEIVKNISALKRVMKYDGLIWADFRTKKDSLFGKGEEISTNFFRLESGTGREGCSYYFTDEEDLRDIFSLAGLEIISLDDYSYSENNREIINSWYHVVAKKN